MVWAVALASAAHDSLCGSHMACVVAAPLCGSGSRGIGVETTVPGLLWAPRRIPDGWMNAVVRRFITGL
jgi:hypothetical protein